MSITLTGTFTRLDGTPATGTVRVTPSRSPIMDPDGKIVISGPQTFPLDKDGKLTFQIPVSNDPDLGPPFTYAVDVNLTHANWKISKVWIPYGSTTVDLSEIGDYTPTPGVATRVVTIPADGADGQVLVWDGAGFVWDFPPEGPQGPKGDLDAEQLAGAPRLTNLVHDTEWVTSNTTIHSQTARTVTFTATDQTGHVRTSRNLIGGASHYVSAEVKTTSDQVNFGPFAAPAYHSGSGDWERLTSRITLTSDAILAVRDTRSSGWDQIEVRDPVMIDLTAVFGAGREPTKEYMDALMAKHGNYIGGVDQFAVGDALQALTVAGPGMTLRHDTSVGERVLLDHPGGSTILWGDTGWRSIPVPTDVPGATPGGDTPAQIRRVGNVVNIIIDRITFTAEYVTGTLAIPVGSGFAPKGSYLPHAGYPATTSRAWLMSSNRLTAYSGVATPDARWNWTYTTTSPWPTTLPGLPA